MKRGFGGRAGENAMTETDRIQRKQLDRKLAPLSESGLRTVPRGGWTKTIRNALGMSSAALGRRIGVSQSAVSQFESGEEHESITLASLHKLADGLECDLVYAFVPRVSLDDIMRHQAERRAQIILDSVSTSMDLEKQPLCEEELEDQLETLVHELLAQPEAGFWSDL